MALIMGLDRYFTGEPCTKGHVAERYMSRKCVQCLLESGKDYETPKQATTRSKEKYIEKNRDRINAKNRAWNKKNSERKAANDRAWNKANQDRVRASRKGYYDADPARFRAKSAAYRGLKLQATPAWLTADHHAQMTAIYAEADRLTKDSGVPHEVDHVVPIAGKNVCGLHVPWNLKAITRTANRSKKNSFAIDTANA